ncbi:sensor domain-containing diguanylate cyclase [Methylobacterium sp. E-046]|uniref:sensor domain-containing diguanylate cyclase n=1 Tax=Methylobacterium sp. E-046 TaxID=2836576 RepID=UPI001FB9DBD8|nr:sensor domain-containing diguanylate cyclase [Methylobacterium sp. E-046]MCJ2102398.1 sensor domain-containing diguanylate cyclase [Methylobacterium sp. E-046]
MAPLQYLARRFRSARTWIVLGVLAPVGMLVASSLMLLDLRQDAWDKAEQTSKNLLQVLECDIARNIEMYDLSLRGVVDNLKAPGLDQVSPELRQLILFDRAATARDMGVMIVTDENGDNIIDASTVPARKVNYADRTYFQAQKAQNNLGLYISQPLFSRLLGSRMIVLSRRINKPNGTFGGVVLGTLNLSYFTRLFGQIDLGRDGAINLYLRDGTRIMRYPFAETDIGVNIAGAPTFQGFLREHSGSFIHTSVRDGIERQYRFTQVGDLPLILNVALSTAEIEAEWRGKALVIGGIVLVLCGLTIALSLLFGRELRRREAMQAELEHLSLTDALTRLPNRRAFEDAFTRATNDTRRSAKPLSLLIVDADHFKRFNDRYGHQVGDDVLRALAGRLSASVHRPQDLVSRIGGEEFALLLPDTDQAGAYLIAEKVHAEVSSLAIGSAGIGAGALTVSIGLASGVPDGKATTALTDLYRLADGALYEAKVGGRNQTRCAKGQDTPAGSQTRPLQVVRGS